MLRKNPFDEIFFVSLIEQKEREAIFNVSPSRLRPHNLKNYNIKRLAYETLDFPRTEIERTLIEAMQIGFD
ncbi:MAG: hypothetical protein ACTMUB_05625 [cyanobacterium endosymbiont of Rhopalodia musculus]|uniref:hypothetical protein n=1 Tax=cyanobacterium endosymbiont of Epithemia clementina EcSB TaxID=3034674 RepID=UPI0024817066|nr:hypothetical protein [cyanobacterium endosymbiont of Epithemia clementina EcSB]WGT67623.1 hypothetical protein P3F56_00485 [cyanobacterium endosymbiont of Epithemia clementina EcSB]